MREKISRSFNQFVELFDSKLSGYASTLLILILIFLFIITVSLTGTYIALSSNLLPHPFYKFISDLFINWFFPSFPKLGPEKYISSLSLILNVMIIFVSLAFSLAPILGSFKQRSEQRKKKFVTSHRIYHNGKDDIDIMYKHFNEAEEVIIRSGDFSWLNHNDEMCNCLQLLAKQGKLHLISYKSMDDVKAGINNEELFQIFSSRFAYGNLNRLKCSYVKRQGSNIFLYRYSNYEANEHRNYILELAQKNETNYLLEVLGHLMA